MIALLLFIAGVAVGAALSSRSAARVAAAIEEDLQLKVEVLHEASDHLYDDLARAGRMLAARDRVIRRLRTRVAQT